MTLFGHIRSADDRIVIRRMPGAQTLLWAVHSVKGSPWTTDARRARIFTLEYAAEMLANSTGGRVLPASSLPLVELENLKQRYVAFGGWLAHGYTKLGKGVRAERARILARMTELERAIHPAPKVHR